MTCEPVARPKEAAAGGPAGQRAAILDAVRDIALERGFGKVTLGEIARRAGISKGGLLYHFPNKEALIRAMFAHARAGETTAGSALGILMAAASAPGLLAALPERVTTADVEDAVARFFVSEASTP